MLSVLKDPRASLSQDIYITVFKRLMDLLLAIVAFPFFLVLTLLLAPMIYFNDRGPIFYNANRVGRNGKLFKMYKFRSMRVDAPDIRMSDGSTYSGVNDPRVTRIGKLLRSTSMDETPQVLNILLGNMSLIGPRPDPPDWLEKYPDDIRVFLKVRPGITGYNQAFFRNLSDGNQKMINDAYYATCCSFVLDLKILLKSFSTVILRKNIYKEFEDPIICPRVAARYDWLRENERNAS